MEDNINLCIFNTTIRNNKVFASIQIQKPNIEIYFLGLFFFLLLNNVHLHNISLSENTIIKNGNISILLV